MPDIKRREQPIYITHPVGVADADDPGVVGAAVVQRVDPNLAAAAAAAEADPAPPLESAAPAIRISCFGKGGKERR